MNDVTLARSSAWLRVILCVVTVTAAEGCARATRAGPEGPRERPALPGRIEDDLFAPELVLAKGAEIHLTDDQRTDIEARARAAQKTWDVLAVRLRAEQAALIEALEQRPVDEGAALRAARAVTRTESALKEAHLLMLVRVKNVLSEEQQRALRR